jgi:hypothetical protein
MRTPLTHAQVEQWIYTTTRKHADLHRQLLEPVHHTEREKVFLEMSRLLQDAIEEVRVISAQLQEESQAAQTRSAHIVAESAPLLAKYTPETESQFLRLFHPAPRPGEHME